MMTGKTIETTNKAMLACFSFLEVTALKTMLCMGAAGIFSSLVSPLLMAESVLRLMRPEASPEVLRPLFALPESFPREVRLSSEKRTEFSFLAPKSPSLLPS